MEGYLISNANFSNDGLFSFVYLLKLIPFRDLLNLCRPYILLVVHSLVCPIYDEVMSVKPIVAQEHLFLSLNG